MERSILVVDDDLAVANSLQVLLTSKQYSVCVVTDPKNVLEILGRENVGLALVDLRMPRLNGVELLQLIKERYPNLPVFIVTGHATVEAAVAAMKFGATDIFTKPVRANHLIREIERVFSTLLPPGESEDECNLISQDPAMLECIQTLQRVASTDVPVLITGESGTGKEVAARMVHQCSPRNEKAMFAVNCAALPDALLESEMFGYEKGAFTDAKERKPGVFELSDRGTIFLDEIGEMSQKTQAKMLRVLQEKKFTPLGGLKTIQSDCRILAATNRNLDDAIRKGEFREDLFYRLSVVSVNIPPLRERPVDIPILAQGFLSSFSDRYKKGPMSFAPEVISILKLHNWPGNVRELKNFVERAVIFSDGPIIRAEQLSPQYRIDLTLVKGQALRDRYLDAAREVMLEALDKADGSKTEAAKLLNIDRKTLYNRMKKYRMA